MNAISILLFSVLLVTGASSPESATTGAPGTSTDQMNSNSPSIPGQQPGSALPPNEAPADSSAQVPSEAKTLYSAGVKLQAERKYLDAIKRFENSVKVYPKYAEAYRALGDCFAKLNKNGEAVSNYEKYLVLNPKAKDASQIRELIIRYKKK